MRRDPATCIFASPKRVDNHILCALHNTWVECQTGYCGDAPMCAYDEPDNSVEAVARRLKRLEEDRP